MTTPVATTPAAPPTHGALLGQRRAIIGLLALQLFLPVLMCLGLGLSYMGAFHDPKPHHLKVAVVGTTPQTEVLAQTIQDKANGALNVITVANRDQAGVQLQHRELAGAFIPDQRHPELLVAGANSGSSATAAEIAFRTVADQQGLPLAVTDVLPLSSHDTSGDGLFFLLIAVSVASYVSASVLGPAAALVGMHIRAALGFGLAVAVSGVGMALAGPIFHVVDHAYLAVWGIMLLYSTGIVAIGLGLHTFLKRLTPLTLMTLFVMLNITSSGGELLPELQNGFFGSLHAFWNGAGFIEGLRSVLYFHDADLGSLILRLALWLTAGVLLTLAAALVERRHPRPVQPDERLLEKIEDELEQAEVVV